MALPDQKTRVKMYEIASRQQQNWEAKIEEAYNYTLPERVNYSSTVPGQTRSFEIFDPTATISLGHFANNLQSTFTPPGSDWMTFSVGSLLKEGDPNYKETQDALQEQSRIFFKLLRASNFNFEITPCLQDMGVSTGILLLNEGDEDNPLIFTSVSIDKVALGKNALTGAIDKVWRKIKVNPSDIETLWPKATLPADIRFQMQNDFGDSDDNKVVLIEGTLTIDGQVYYYVQDHSTGKDILVEKRDFFPWFIFRMGTRTDEILGWGPVLQAMPAIRVLNKMAEIELKAANFKAFPPYIGIDSATWNVNFARLEPSSILPVGMEFLNADPLRPIPTNGDPRFAELTIEKQQQFIRELLFANPLPPVSSPTMTATEISIRQQNWLRNNSTSIYRIMSEAITPMIKACINILTKKGLMDDIIVDGKRANIEFDSPLLLLQGQERFARIQEYTNFFVQTLGPQLGLSMVNLEEMPGIVGEDLGVDSRIVSSKEKIEGMVKTFQKQAENAAQDQQDQQLPPEQSAQQTQQ